jgi:hypothetical protein
MKVRQRIADRALWLAVAEAAQLGMVTCPEAPTLDAALYGLTLSCAQAGLGIDDDLRASLAFSEAGDADLSFAWTLEDCHAPRRHE